MRFCFKFLEQSITTNKPSTTQDDRPTMSREEAAIPDILNQVLDEYGGRISIDGGSEVLVSDAQVAHALYKATEGVRNPEGPKITVAKRGLQGENDSDIEGIANCRFEPADNLRFEFYTHALFGVASEDPKFILQGLKYMITAMRPKAIAVVICPKMESGQTTGEDQLTLSMEDKLKYQSKGKVEKLSDVLEYAGFERGKIRGMEKSSEAAGAKVEAEVVLAMKWDQLTG